MQGFVRFHIPLWVRRSVTMLPSFIVILMGLDPTRILVMSQVLLSFGYRAGAGAAADLYQNKTLMGELVNSLVKRTGWAIVVVVVALNLWLWWHRVGSLKEKGAGRLLFALMVTVAMTWPRPFRRDSQPPRRSSRSFQPSR